jgi:hypothetical protein
MSAARRVTIEQGARGELEFPGALQARRDRLILSFSRISPRDQLTLCELADQMAMAATQDAVGDAVARRQRAAREHRQQLKDVQQQLQTDLSTARRWAREMGRSARRLRP